MKVQGHYFKESPALIEPNIQGLNNGFEVKVTETVIIYVLGGNDLAESTLLLLMSHLIGNAFMWSQISCGNLKKKKNKKTRERSINFPTKHCHKHFLLEAFLLSIPLPHPGKDTV